MNSETSSLVLDPRRAWSLELPLLPTPTNRLTLRALLTMSGGMVRIEGTDRLAAAPIPAIFALSHHNAWEAVLSPAALIAARRGRRIRFLVDWMLADLPWTGWLVRQLHPIPVYRKRARFGMFEGYRRRRDRESSPIDGATAALAAGEDVGIYPEGRRNSDPFYLQRGRLGVGLVALRSGAPVLPVGVDFAARHRILRTPRIGRFALRVGEPLLFAAERAAWLEAGTGERAGLESRLAPQIIDRVFRDLARLSRKVYILPSRPRLAAERGRAADRVRQPAPEVSVARVSNSADRAAALEVIAEVYAAEKGWLAEVDGEIDVDPGGDRRNSWLLARVDGEPAGALRLHYDPSLELPAEAEVEWEPGVDLVALAQAGRFVEIGRLTIRPAFRNRPAIVLELMGAAVEEVRARGYSHLLTAVFEDDPHSPYRFHTRVLGFERIGTHRRGELRCASRRILLVLDLEKGFARLRARGGRRLERLRAAETSRDAELVAAS